MKQVLTLAWIALGIAAFARLGLFAWRLTFGFGDVIHINIFVALLIFLLALAWVASWAVKRRQ
ncbi:hypothetical protein [Sphingobium sp. DN12]|uniref:hypothetical protein n=1 Tax=Sphingobium sp. DN12 TaxID=3378073 RepID=UPI003DA1D9FB